MPFVALDVSGEPLPGDWPQSEDRAAEVAVGLGKPVLIERLPDLEEDDGEARVR